MALINYSTDLNFEQDGGVLINKIRADILILFFINALREVSFKKF
jgi:hypothetical protein